MALYSFASHLLHVCFFFCILGAAGILLRFFLEKPQEADFPARRGGVFANNALFTGGIVLPACLLTVNSAILLYAFVTHDFTVEYVAQYSDRTLPLFYRVTAFWAGQAGSLLFWAWSVALGGAAFVLLPAFARLTPRTRQWYCLFYFCIMAFFLLVLALWSNPFDLLDFTPRDGRGLNPLLQNPGMIFHPPLLFLGYGGFVVPGCLALAQTLSGHLQDPAKDKRAEDHWGQVSRPFILLAWSLLTAGIVLGAWWAYMELGWGGYWAWDPVENASLIPWLVASAYLHTAVIGSRRGKLQRTNVFLMALTTISAFFATYLVRSGVVESLHAFGDGGVGTPLLIFTLIFLYLALYIAMAEPGPGASKASFSVRAVTGGVLVLLFIAVASYQVLGLNLPPALVGGLMLALAAALFFGKSKKTDTRELEDLTSKEGLLLIVAWLLLALSFIILVATLWPVIINALMGISGMLPDGIASRLPQKPMGLEPAFYNRTCLPLFALFAVMLVICPWRKWKLLPDTSGFSQPRFFLSVLGAALLIGVALRGVGITHPVALMAAAASLAALYGIVLLFVKNRGLVSIRSTMAAHGVHFGLLLMILGVAFSGPYQRQHTIELGRDQNVALGAAHSRADEGGGLQNSVAGGYRLLLNELYEGEGQIGRDGKPNFRFIEAELLVTDENGKPMGKLAPQRRLYTNFENQTYAEVSTLFSLGNEIYATLLSVDGNGRAVLQVNINPLVNWLWIGGTIMCLFPLLGLSRVRRLKEEDA